MLQFSSMNSSEISAFQNIVWEYYDAHGRHELPWRRSQPDDSFDPYKIVVSELMLQQTQVSRVIPKFEAFIDRFPTFTALAEAPLSDVLVLWSGLGYNRRAKFLWQLAQRVVSDFAGALPYERSELVSLPGIGPNTAGAVRAYAYNQPDIFIETNVRTVLFHHFFADQTGISDKALIPILEQILPKDNAREWYWALMDYGTFLKQTVGNLSRASTSYAKQSTFHGSRRQIRGQVLKLLTAGPMALSVLRGHIVDERLEAVLRDLVTEQFIEQTGTQYRLCS